MNQNVICAKINQTFLFVYIQVTNHEDVFINQKADDKSCPKLNSLLEENPDLPLEFIESIEELP